MQQIGAWLKASRTETKEHPRWCESIQSDCDASLVLPPHSGPTAVPAPPQPSMSEEPADSRWYCTEVSLHCLVKAAHQLKSCRGLLAFRDASSEQPSEHLPSVFPSSSLLPRANGEAIRESLT